jgi:hypothetical protein
MKNKIQQIHTYVTGGIDVDVFYYSNTFFNGKRIYPPHKTGVFCYYVNMSECEVVIHRLYYCKKMDVAIGFYEGEVYEINIPWSILFLDII